MSHTDNVTLKFNLDKSQKSRQDNILSSLWTLALSVCAFWGFIGILCTVFSIRLNIAAVLLCTTISSTALIFLQKKLHFIGMIAPLLSTVVLFIFSWESVINGFIYTLNCVINTIGTKFGRIMTELEVLPVQLSDIESAQTLFFSAASMLLSYAVVFSVRNSDIIIPIMFLLIELSICITFEMCPSFIYICPAVLYVLGTAIKKFTGINLIGISAWSFSVLICIICSLIFSFTGLKSNYNGNEFYKIKNEIYKTVDTLHYGKSEVMPEGDFSNLQPFNPTEKTQLEVIMSKPDSLYLRGFVGEHYNGSGWEQIDNSLLYKNSSLFFWLHKNLFYGQTQLAQAALLPQNIQKNTNKITINNIGASSKYIFTPYELISADSEMLDPNAIGDKNLLSKGLNGNRIYSFEALENQVKQYPYIINNIKALSSSKTKEYINNENHYRDFVYSAYLEIPEKTKSLLKNQLGEYNLKENSHLDYSQAQQNILSYLSAKVSYNTNATFVQDNNKDFLQYFLEQSGEGYSVHYATAATLMFRYYGIPSRYVEGFLITPEEAENTLSNSPITVDGSHFHAWVEFYRDGVGWIPFEVTPPYLNLMEKAEEISPLPDSDTASNNKNDTVNNNDIQQGEIQSHKIQQKSFFKYTFIIAIIILSAVILVLLFICFYRRKKLYKRIKTFKTCENIESVQLMFSYMIDILKSAGYIDNENLLYFYDSSLYNKLNDAGYQLKTALYIYEKAKYSKHDISDSERLAVSNALAAIIDQVKHESSFIRNLKYRFIKCIYK